MIPVSLLSLTTLSVEDCVYRGEGNANIVVALPDEQKIIRFRKSFPDDVSPDGGKQRAEREAEFVRFVASCFLGSYTQIPEILRCDMKDIMKLSEAIRTFRPDKRRNKEITEIYATKFPDYTLLQTQLDSSIFRSNDTYCLEIKPKQGYLRDIDRMFQKCPFCLSQYYKLRKKIITRRSSYCPFDLFSGAEGRMKTALMGLLKSPQNNLKIFKNGTVVYDHESSLNDLENILTDWFRHSVHATKDENINKFCSLICAALLHPFASKEYDAANVFVGCESCIRPKEDSKTTTYINPDLITRAKKILYFAGEVCNVKAETLPKNSVLERILRMQKLPFASSDYIYSAYLKLRSFLTDDTIYSSLMEMHKLGGQQILCCKQKKILEGIGKLKKVSVKTCIKDTSPRKARLGDYNSNKHFNGTGENISDIEKSTLLASVSGNSLLKNNKPCIAQGIIQNGDNTLPNEKTAHNTIDMESILSMQKYLLFSCARDCSILMSFREINPNIISSTIDEDIIQLPDGTSFVCNIQISDLDPKSLSCIEKHRQRDINTLNSVISILEEELILKDQISCKSQSGQ